MKRLLKKDYAQEKCMIDGVNDCDLGVPCGHKKTNYKRMNKNYFLLLFLIFLFPMSSMATDGYFMLGHGSISKGLAGTGVAYYRTSIIGGNPGGNAFLGRQYSLASNFILLDRKYNIIGNPSMQPGTVGLAPGKVTSDTKLFIVPTLGANWMLNDKSALGISLYGCGFNTNYPTQTFGDPSSESTGVTLWQIQANPTYSLKLGEKHGIGVSAIIGIELFEAKGLATFGALGFSSDPSKLSGNGLKSSIGLGFKIGYMGEIVNHLHLGATFQTKTNMGEFDDYAGLFPEKGDFDIPASMTVGVNYEFSDKLKVLFDVQQIYYSGVNGTGNSMSKLSEGNLLGSDDGPGFGWKDMTVFKLGAEFAPNSSWTFRLGGAYGEQPVPKSEVLFNILAPAINKTHITFGTSRNVGTDGKAINFAFVHAFKNNVKGPNPLDPAQQIELEISQFEFEIGFTF